MADMKGQVIRIDQKTMIVLTEEGDFLRVPVVKPRPNPGDIVDVYPSTAKYFTIPSWIRAAAVVLILGLSLLLARPFVLPQAVAAVSMDLSSSIELSINKENEVLEVKANNEQGEGVLHNMNLIGMDIYEAANLVTAKAVQLGYLPAADETTIMVTVAPLTKSGNVAVNREKLQQAMHEELVKQKYEGYLVVNQGAGEIKKAADEMGLTVNQYTVWSQMQGRMGQISIQDFKGKPLGKMISGDETNLNRMFPGMWSRVDRPACQPGEGQTGNTELSAEQSLEQNAASSAAPDSPQVNANSLVPQNAGFGMRGPGIRNGVGNSDGLGDDACSPRDSTQ